MKRIDNLDWSTIELSALRRQPRVTLPPTYRLQDDSGNGCAGDPPGYPSYFTRCVWTAHGDSPSRGPVCVIACDGKLYDVSESYDGDAATREALFRRLWRPLPLQHPRTRAWIRDTFKHHNSCYQVPELVEKGKSWSDALLVWPGGCLGNTPFGRLRDAGLEIERARKHRDYDKWELRHKHAFLDEIVLDNRRITQACEAAATPENHRGTVIVRRYYPEFEPTAELIAAGFDSPGNWWETLAENPGPAKCPGQYGTPHPVNGSWCQFCGWHAKEDK